MYTFRKNLITFILACTTCIQAFAMASEPHWIFRYETGGGALGSSHLTVRISDDRQLTAVAVGLPITKRGMTRRRFSKKITQAELQEIVRLAILAHDFVDSQEPESVHARWAEMMVIDGREKIMRRSGPLPGHEPQQAQTRLLLDAIEQHYPSVLRALP